MVLSFITAKYFYRATITVSADNNHRVIDNISENPALTLTLIHFRI